MKANVLFVFLIGIFLVCRSAEASFLTSEDNKKSIEFSGYHWQVKTGYDYPGRNNWSSDNVWKDENGWLHLSLTHRGGGWYCAEVRSAEFFTYGQFRFQVISSFEKLDPQIVFGLFLYNDATKEEIDIEFSRWGYRNQQNGIYSIYDMTGKKTSYAFDVFLPEGNYSTHQLEWQEKQIAFSSQYGHQEDQQSGFARWHYYQEDKKTVIPYSRMRVHFNLWLYKGQAPRNESNSEVVIRNFCYDP